MTFPILALNPPVVEASSSTPYLIIGHTGALDAEVPLSVPYLITGRMTDRAGSREAKPYLIFTGD